MKHSTKDSADLILRKILFLRYGVDEVSPEKPPVPLLSWMQVSKLLKEPYYRVMTI